MERTLCIVLAVCCLIFALPGLVVHATAPYEITTEHSGDRLSRMDITMTDMSQGAAEITLSEILPVTQDLSKAPLIKVTSKKDFVTTLHFTMDAACGGVVALWQGDSRLLVSYPDTQAGNRITVCVTGTGSFKLVNMARKFPDVTEDLWAKNQIDYMTGRGYITGKLDGTFGHSETIQRRTVAMLLWRIAGSPEVTGTCPFTDVIQDRYYQAILWAYQQGIINGYKDGTFRSTDIISRQHFIVMLKRFADSEELELPTVDNGSVSSFRDYEKIGTSFREAAQWGMDCGLMLGRANNVYDPAGNTSRAQMAVILSRFLIARTQVIPPDPNDHGGPNETPIL